ncbi:unnamed protein product [Cochlearia groenlandica]
MVFPGERDYMAETTATRPERSKSLHNFKLPSLKWGNQRHLKCMKIDSISNGGSGDHRLRRRYPPLRFDGSSSPIKRDNHRKNGCGEEGIKEYRVKIMSDLKSARDKITQSLFIEEEDETHRFGFGSGSGSGSGKEKEKEKEISPVKPWNLRKRRAACKEPDSKIEEKNTVANPSPPIKERKTKVVVELSKKDIEDDFAAILGRRPPRRPKKRPRTVQNSLDNIFPGLYLSEVTLDAYKVQEEAKTTYLPYDNQTLSLYIVQHKDRVRYIPEPPHLLTQLLKIYSSKQLLPLRATYHCSSVHLNLKPVVLPITFLESLHAICVGVFTAREVLNPPLKVVITNFESDKVIEFDAKRWPDAKNGDPSRHSTRFRSLKLYTLSNQTFGMTDTLSQSSVPMLYLADDNETIREKPAELNDDWLTDINPNSKVVVSDAYAVSILKDAAVGDRFQFERLGKKVLAKILDEQTLDISFDH